MVRPNAMTDTPTYTQSLGNQSALKIMFSIILLRATLASLSPQMELHRQPLVPITAEALKEVRVGSDIRLLNADICCCARC